MIDRCETTAPSDAEDFFGLEQKLSKMISSEITKHDSLYRADICICITITYQDPLRGHQ